MAYFDPTTDSKKRSAPKIMTVSASERFGGSPVPAMHQGHIPRPVALDMDHINFIKDHSHGRSDVLPNGHIDVVHDVGEGDILLTRRNTRGTMTSTPKVIAALNGLSENTQTIDWICAGFAMVHHKPFSKHVGSGQGINPLSTFTASLTGLNTIRNYGPYTIQMGEEVAFYIPKKNEIVYLDVDGRSPDRVAVPIRPYRASSVVEQLPKYYTSMLQSTSKSPAPVNLADMETRNRYKHSDLIALSIATEALMTVMRGVEALTIMGYIQPVTATMLSDTPVPATGAFAAVDTEGGAALKGRYPGIVLGDAVADNDADTMKTSLEGVPRDLPDNAVRASLAVVYTTAGVGGSVVYQPVKSLPFTATQTTKNWVKRLAETDESLDVARSDELESASLADYRARTISAYSTDAPTLKAQVENTKRILHIATKLGLVRDETTKANEHLREGVLRTIFAGQLEPGSRKDMFAPEIKGAEVTNDGHRRLLAQYTTLCKEFKAHGMEGMTRMITDSRKSIIGVAKSHIGPGAKGIILT